MKTTIEYRDGRTKTTKDVMPVIYLDDAQMTVLVNDAMESESDDIALSTVKRIIFEP